MQKVIETFLFYGRAVNVKMLTAIRDISSTQASPTEYILKRTNNFLGYSATHPDAILTYTASDMVLEVHSETSCLSEPNKRSLTGGHLFLSVDTRNTTNNGAVINIYQIIKAVMTLAVEAELGDLFINT